MNKIINDIGNYYEVKEDVAYITVLKKDGTELITKIDLENLEKIKNMGTWFAEWNKDYNNYIAQNISKTKKNSKNKPLKQSIASVLLKVSPKAPIKYLNGDTLDNRRCNLDIAKKNSGNEYEEKDENTISIILKDKLDKKEGYALISKEDLALVINDTYSWVLHKTHGNVSVVANTPEGRLPLWKVIMKPQENQYIEFKNHNPLDNRRSNLILKNHEEENQ